MAVSQFTRYSSADASGPGLLAATNGDLCRVLKACLVDGYSGHAAAGWTQPFAIASNIGCFKPSAGSQMTLVVGDDGTAAVGLGARSAYFTGWETVAGIATPVGSGTGQFPLAAQVGSVGALQCSKGDTNGSSRSWVIYADAYGFYMFNALSSTGVNWSACGFGDIYALNPTVDTYRTAVYGNGQSGMNATNQYSERLGAMYLPGGQYPWNPGIPHHYAARTGAGGGSSTLVTLVGNESLPNTNGPFGYRNGAVPFGPANVQMLSPVKVHETSGQLRGYQRGMYFSNHPGSNYANGFTFPGGGDYVGKTFECIGPGWNGSYWIVETSNTVLTN